LVVAAASVASLCARVLAGWLTDRRGSDGLLPAAAMIGLGALGMVAMASGTTALTVAGVVVAFCGGWGWPALLLLGVLTYHPGRAATASGRFQLGTAMGAAVGPLLFAIVSDAAGFATAWSVIAGSTVLSAVLVALNARGRRAGRTTALAGGSP
jgi:MFS family permease